MYIYAHAGGLISVASNTGSAVGPDFATAQVLPLAEVRRLIVDACRNGDKVWVSSDDGPHTVNTLRALGGPGIHLEAFESVGSQAADSDGAVGLLGAVYDGRDDLVDDLIARGASPHVTDTQGNTGLHFAAMVGSLHGINALVEAGADVNATNFDGDRPRDLAMHWGDRAAADLLLVHGSITEVNLPEQINSQPISFTKSTRGMVHYWVFVKTFWNVMGVLMLTVPIAIPIRIGVSALNFTVAWVFSPPWRVIWFGAPWQLTGTLLEMRRPFQRRAIVDLNKTSQAIASGLNNIIMRYGGRIFTWTVLLSHPEGIRLSRKEMARLNVSAEAVEELTDPDEPVIILNFYGTPGVPLMRTLGAVVQRAGGELSTSFVDTLRLVERYFSRSTKKEQKKRTSQ